jgi:hypothetical protein
MSMIDTAKKHPYLLGGVALLALIIIWVATKQSNAGAVEMPATPQGSVETGTAMQVAAMQASAHANDLQAQLQDDQNKINGSIALADIQGKYSFDIAGLQASIASKNLDVTAANSTLAAQLKGKELEYQRDIQLGSFDTQKDLAQINATTQLSLVQSLTAMMTGQQARADAIRQQQTQIDSEIVATQAKLSTWNTSFASQPVAWQQSVMQGSGGYLDYKNSLVAHIADLQNQRANATGTVYTTAPHPVT